MEKIKMRRVIFTAFFFVSLFGIFNISDVLTSALQAANNGEWKAADYFTVKIFLDFVGYAILTKCDIVIREYWRDDK